MMALSAGSIAGMSTAFALGGTLLAMSAAADSGWRWAMSWLSVPLIPIILVMLGLREPPRRGTVIARPSNRQAFAELWRYREVAIPIALGGVVAMIGDGAAMIWAAPTLSRQFKIPPDRVGALVATVLLVSGLVGPLVGGVLADICQRTRGPRRTMAAAAGLTLLSVPLGLFAVATHVQWFTVLFTAFMTIGVALNVMMPALTTIVIPNELRGVCMAVMSVVRRLWRHCNDWPCSGIRLRRRQCSRRSSIRRGHALFSAPDGAPSRPISAEMIP